MRFVFLLLFIQTSFAADLNNEEEARKAAEVLGATYHPKDVNDKSDVLIDFEDKSGMNDEEKDVVMANYERTKSVYKEDSSDTLFERISKAYVRNLDRILTRKKQN
jgi:hypothetical protein